MLDKNATVGRIPFMGRNKRTHSNFKTKKSEKGKVFEEIYQQIMLVKIRLRWIDYKCSDEFLQGYLEESARL